MVFISYSLYIFLAVKTYEYQENNLEYSELF